MDLTILIPALNEARNLQSLLPDVARVSREMAVDSEIVIVDGGSGLDTRPVAEKAGALFLHQTSPGYGGALSEGFGSAKSDYVLTMDADYSHEPALIRTLWDNRHEADLLIASRYVAGGSAQCGVFRSSLSRLLNGIYRRFLRLPFQDLSSGFRLYRTESLRRVKPVGRDSAALRSRSSNPRGSVSLPLAPRRSLAGEAVPLRLGLLEDAASHEAAQKAWAHGAEPRP